MHFHYGAIYYFQMSEHNAKQQAHGTHLQYAWSVWSVILPDQRVTIHVVEQASYHYTSREKEQAERMKGQ